MVRASLIQGRRGWQGRERERMVAEHETYQLEYARSYPLVISHRANMKMNPENTIAGINAAIAACVDGIEIDVQATADGAVVLMHDCSMHRATGDPRAIGDINLEQARELRVQAPQLDMESEPIALLSEALAAASEQAILVLDIKMDGIAPLVARVIRASGRTEMLHVGCDLREAPEYCELLPEIPIASGLRPGDIRREGYLALLDRCVAVGLSGVSIRNTLLDRCAVREAHRRGLMVKTWTVDRTPDIERVLAAGVDAICGNYPALMRAARERTLQEHPLDADDR